MKIVPSYTEQEMGLGKTLSVLALIAWYLDGLPLKRTGPSTTLIITTLSSKSPCVIIWVYPTNYEKRSPDGNNKLQGSMDSFHSIIFRQLTI